MRTIKESKKFDGLLTAELEHEITKTTGYMLYSGPKIPQDEWHRMMSFFRWTYQEFKGEAQVRWYVNTTLGTWKCWAFPQEARAGMTTKELDTPDYKTQRAQFGADWIYFMTVHHHCQASAFQSGVDSNDEQNQDGLHITIGNIDKDKHDLHARFYLDKLKFDPQMGEFWQLDPRVVEVVPQELWDKICRFQMCAKIEMPFPQAWRDNMVEIKTVTYPPYTHSGGYSAGGSSGVGFTHGGAGTNGSNGTGVYSPSHNTRSMWDRAEDACSELEQKILYNRFTEDELVDGLNKIQGDEVLECICDAIWHHDVSIERIISSWTEPARVRGGEQRDLKLAENNPTSGPTTTPATSTGMVDATPYDEETGWNHMCQ